MEARFTRVRELGKGSFGCAVLVTSKEDGKQYVIKEVDLRRMGKEERQAAHQEAQVWFVCMFLFGNWCVRGGCM